MQTEFFRLDILTPVHIGTGEEIDPMSYLMRREAHGPACHIVDTNAWAVDYPDPDELCAKFSGGNIPQMRKFMADTLDPDLYAMRSILVTDDAIFREYEQKRDDQRTSNQLRISPQTSGNGHAPIIPGSSLKGALRTAVIDWLDREQQLGLKQARTPREYNDKLESALGKITESAFKQLKISDVQGWVDSTQLVEALEIRRKEGKSTTPKSKAEVLPGQLAQGGSDATTLYGKLALGASAQATNNRLTLPGGKSWGWLELAALVNGYLLPRLEAEWDKFYQQSHFAKARPIVEQLRQMLAAAEPGQMFLRVGHYSQVEFVTVRNNQPLTRKGRDGRSIPHGTTRTLANGLYPFGWVRLTPCSEQEYAQASARRETEGRQTGLTRLKRRAQIAEEKGQLQAEQQEKQRQAEHAAEAEAKRQADLDAMSPLDRQLLMLASGELLEHQVVELFNSLSDLDGADLKRAACSIQSYWQQQGKWHKKDCSKKQWEKVQQLKSHLGED